MTQAIQDAAGILREAQRILFITGAGISADSGLPTYRGIGGLYDGDTTEDGMRIEEALSGAMFLERPEITWKYLRQIEEGARGKSPNRAHEIIAEFEERAELVWVLTQNVDGFHIQAGSTKVISIHGDMHDLRCTKCAWTDRVSSYDDMTIPPECPECNAPARPDVVLFGELLNPANIDRLYDLQESGVQAVVSIGTTSVFPYIAGPVHQARLKGVPTIEVNPGDTEVSEHVDIRIKVGAAEAMEQIWRVLQSES